MILQPIDFVVYAWLGIALLSAAYVAYDQFRRNPEATVMKWGFVLVTLYMGVVLVLLRLAVEAVEGALRRAESELHERGRTMNA